MVSVRDTGVGLPPQPAERIFDAFFTTKPDGTGMGLSISRAIIAAHGGRLWADDNAPRGAIFHLTVPVEAEPSRRGVAPAQFILVNGIAAVANGSDLWSRRIGATYTKVQYRASSLYPILPGQCDGRGPLCGVRPGLSSSRHRKVGFCRTSP